MEECTITEAQDRMMFETDYKLDRYTNILTYNHTRVKLNHAPDTDYINACYVDVS